ncbi:MAG: hypothetical protein LBR28_00170 [Bacteroidales bacterium]|jgi:tetratricopeptide (TPR) repeat protein|nr:hypothetical protein [Bacteroidales bacterium]
MQEDVIYTEIRDLIDKFKYDKAIILLDSLIKSGKATDITYYIKGNIYRRQNDWKNAIDNYSIAIELNSESPAVTAKEMVINILNFYNKDMYNH